jgi:tetratricopeptide (TPR) repeat protein
MSSKLIRSRQAVVLSLILTGTQGLACAALLFLPATGVAQSGSTDSEPGKIVILNRGKFVPKEVTTIDGGPDEGGILNAHYFPGLVLYRHANFRAAKDEMDYFINRPQYTRMNPKQAEYFSNAHYVRGTIYLYHASGMGRHVLAKKDFERSIQWNPRNYLSYLELSHVWAAVGLNDQAVSVLHRLLELKPDEAVAQQATKELNSLQSTGKK